MMFVTIINAALVVVFNYKWTLFSLGTILREAFVTWMFVSADPRGMEPVICKPPATNLA